MTNFEFITTKANAFDIAGLILNCANDPCVCCCNYSLDKRDCVKLNLRLQNACLIGIADELDMEEIKSMSLPQLTDWIYDKSIYVAPSSPPYGYVGDIKAIEQWLATEYY